MTNVTSLLKTVKAVEDEATRGTRALEATIEYIKQELTVRAPSRPKPLLPRSFGSRLMRHSLSCKSWLKQGQRYLCLLFPGKQESLFSLFSFFFYFIICLAHFLPASLSAPVGFSQLLSGSGEKVQAEREKQEDLGSLLFVI